MRPFHYTSLALLAALVALGFACFYFSISWWWLLAPLFLYSVLLVLGAIYIRWDFYMKSEHRGRNPEWLALTFDDGPAAETAAILDILREQNVPAAFFSIGKHAAARPDMVLRWDQEGHLIGNHSYSHGFNFDWQRAGRMQQEIEQTNQTIARITGRRPRFFRPPYGVTNPNLARAVARTGMHSIGWNIRSFDTTATDGPALLARILGQVSGGDIILLHDSMPLTREILTELIERARKKGFTFVRLDHMLGLNGYA